MYKFNTWAEETAVWVEESIPVKRLIWDSNARRETTAEKA